jgi:hypothetical protein
MSEITLTIDSIYGGQAPTKFFGKKGQFNSTIGIDPDFPISDSDTEISGFIRPTAMEKFTGTTITGSPMWIATDPKDANIYIYDTDGKVYNTTSALGTPTLLTTLSTASGNGMEYYDNAMYIARNTDIARYTPLNGTPGFTTSYWVTTM